MAETSRFSLNDNSSDDRYPSGSTLLSGSYKTVGESLSSRYPDVSKSGDRDTGETILEMTSIVNLVPAPAYSSNPINK